MVVFLIVFSTHEAFSNPSFYLFLSKFCCGGLMLNLVITKLGRKFLVKDSLDCVACLL